MGNRSVPRIGGERQRRVMGVPHFVQSSIPCDSARVGPDFVAPPAVEIPVERRPLADPLGVFTQEPVWPTRRDVAVGPSSRGSFAGWWAALLVGAMALVGGVWGTALVVAQQQPRVDRGDRVMGGTSVTPVPMPTVLMEPDEMAIPGVPEQAESEGFEVTAEGTVTIPLDDWRDDLPGGGTLPWWDYFGKHAPDSSWEYEGMLPGDDAITPNGAETSDGPGVSPDAITPAPGQAIPAAPTTGHARFVRHTQTALADSPTDPVTAPAGTPIAS